MERRPLSRAGSAQTTIDRIEELFTPLRGLCGLLLEAERQDVAFILEPLLAAAYEGSLSVARKLDDREVRHG